MSDCGGLISGAIPNTAGFELSIQMVFTGCASITSMVLPSDLTKIPAYTFGNCTSLRTITSGTGAPLTDIGASAFSGCTKLQTLSFA
jgi:hypothetical protein